METMLFITVRVNKHIKISVIMWSFATIWKPAFIGLLSFITVQLLFGNKRLWELKSNMFKFNFKFKNAIRVAMKIDISKSNIHVHVSVHGSLICAVTIFS